MADDPQTGATWAPDPTESFEHAKAVFEQNCAQFRHLNDQMNRIPPFAVTLTGGFWYVAVAVGHDGTHNGDLDALARFALMIFAGICDFALVGIAIRVRDVMSTYLRRMARFQGPSWVGGDDDPAARLPDYSMISMYAILMFAGGVLSWVGAFVLFRPERFLTLWQGAGAVAFALAAVLGASYIVPRWLSR